MLFIKIRKWFFASCLILLSLNTIASAEDTREPSSPDLKSVQTNTNETNAKSGTDNVTCNIYKTNCISSYEPNTVGLTADRHKKPFLDYKLSLMYPFFHSFKIPYIVDSDSTITLFAVSVRFAQFISEESSPVVGMRYNPKLIFRTMLEHTPKENANKKGSYLHYWDISYGHESNGQKISSRAQYDLYSQQVGDKEIANDAISRGWDYFELTYGLENKQITASSKTFSVIVHLKYFLPWGIFEGHKEEYQSWENNPAGKPRSEVNGVGALGKYMSDTWKIAGIVETGYQQFGRYVSARGELTLKLVKIPIMLWASYGYNLNGDLAVYYRAFASGGVALDLGSF